MEYIPEEITFLIFDYLSTNELYNLKGIEIFSNYVRKYVYNKFIKNLNIILKKDDAFRLLSYLKEKNAHIAGVYMDQPPNEKGWNIFDIEIYVNDTEMAITENYQTNKSMRNSIEKISTDLKSVDVLRFNNKLKGSVENNNFKRFLYTYNDEKLHCNINSCNTMEFIFIDNKIDFSKCGFEYGIYRDIFYYNNSDNNFDFYIC